MMKVGKKWKGQSREHSTSACFHVAFVLAEGSRGVLHVIVQGQGPRAYITVKQPKAQGTG